MRKRPLFPYWTDLEWVNGIMQNQTASELRLTLVSIEAYTRYGFLLTMNIEAITPNEMFNRLGIGWMRAALVDQGENQYSSLRAVILGTVWKSRFFGRTILICMPPLSKQTHELTITIDSIEWEFTDGDEIQPPSLIIPGPWKFVISL